MRKPGPWGHKEPDMTGRLKTSNMCTCDHLKVKAVNQSVYVCMCLCVMDTYWQNNHRRHTGYLMHIHLTPFEMPLKCLFPYASLSLLFLRFFLMCLLNKLQHRFHFLFHFFFLAHRACGILVPVPHFKLTYPALEGKVLSAGPSGKSPHSRLLSTRPIYPSGWWTYSHHGRGLSQLEPICTWWAPWPKCSHHS